MKQKLLMLALLFFTAVGACWSADPPAEGVYRMKNANYDNAWITEDFAAHDLNCEAKGSATAYQQMWKLTKSGSNYYMMNVFTGRYVQQQSQTYQKFTTGTSRVAVQIAATGDGHFNITCGRPMHAQGGAQVVPWDASAEGSHWIIEKVNGITDEVITQAQAQYAELSELTSASNVSKFQKLLPDFFQDYACTQLKAEQQAKTDEQLRADMAQAGLPSELQEIAVKVKNGWWSNSSSSVADKNQYAEEFRIRDYQPYSDAASWQNMLGHYAFSYMSNPSGIYANSRDIVFAFVDQDVPSGATLQLVPIQGNELINGRGWGTALHRGLNMMVVPRDLSMLYVLYTVDTDMNGKAKKVADYPAIRIHLEGGQAVGFYEKPEAQSTADDAKYKYLMNLTPAGGIFVCKGHRGIFSFSKEAYAQTWPEHVYHAINWYDGVVQWEEDLMGFTTAVANGSMADTEESVAGGKALWPEYVNNLSFALQGPQGSNPNASSWRTSYPSIWGVESSFNAYRENFDTWCAGHEVGHSHQGLINLESSTESSNNFFSGVVNHMSGFRMSRGGSIDDLNGYVQDGFKPFQLRDIGLTHRMWYQLWLYFHKAGHMKTFYPELFCELRKDPLVLSPTDPNSPNVHCTTSGLKFVQKVCKVAKMNLTSFFQAWGFFTPYKNAEFGDYSTRYGTITQADIDRVKTEIAKYGDDNPSLMFLEDRIKPSQRFDVWKKSNPSQNWRQRHDGGAFRQGEYGDVGNWTDYVEGQTTPAHYVYSLSGTNLSLDGEGGVGFQVWDKDGENLRIVSNHLQIELGAELAAGGFQVRAYNADGTYQTIQDVSVAGSDEQKLNALKAALEDAAGYTRLSDTTGNKVGFYQDDKLQTLKDLIAQGQDAKNSGDPDAYAAATKALADEMLRLSTAGVMNQVQPTGLYVFKNRSQGQYITLSGTVLQKGSSTAAASQFAFVPAGEEGLYYLQNRSTAKYISSIQRSVQAKVEATSQADAITFRLTALGGGFFGVLPQNGSPALHMDGGGKIVGWDIGDNQNSMWSITRVEDMGQEATPEALAALISEAQHLLPAAANISAANDALSLQATDSAAPNYLSTTFRVTGKLANLCDGNLGNYASIAATAATEETPAVNPSLLIDLGSDAKLRLKAVSFGFTTAKSYPKRKPTLVTLYAGNSSSNVNTEICTFTTDERQQSPLPEAASGQESWESPIIVAGSTAYRFWRLQVNQTNATNGALPFALGELTMAARTLTPTLTEAYEQAGGRMTEINTLINQGAKASFTLQAPDVTALSIYAIYGNLRKALDAIEKRGITPLPDGVGGIEAEGQSAAPNSIYDLQGRRLQHTQRGVLIIDGQKRVVK